MKTDVTQPSTVFLQAKTCYLRPIEETDIPTLTRWINDPEVTQFLETCMPLTQVAEKKWLDSLVGSKTDIALLIVTNAGKPIGVMGIHHINWIDRLATTGAFIGEKEYWGKGYGTDAKMILLNYAFNTLNLRKICSRVYTFNGRSIAYSKHCGYVDDGIQKKHVFRNGEYHDVVQLALFKESWLPHWITYQKGLKAHGVRRKNR